MSTPTVRPFYPCPRIGESAPETTVGMAYPLDALRVLATGAETPRDDLRAELRAAGIL